ncbi:MAG: N-acetyltransferase [Cyanobacteriota bacterium]|nr:N-acetyltransferase [Synechococcus sp. FGCU3]MEB3104162.1 N-acetyltransferase [Cyanobacteriota bacterium]
MIPFRSQPAAPRLAEGYRLLENTPPSPEALNRLLTLMGDPPRSTERWSLVLEHSLWHFSVLDPAEQLVGFVRITSDLALNANLWDLAADPADPEQRGVLLALVHAALSRLRRELGGCSISLSAPPAALEALERHGFVVDPGGIRAMGLQLVRD